MHPAKVCVDIGEVLGQGGEFTGVRVGGVEDVKCGLRVLDEKVY